MKKPVGAFIVGNVIKFKPFEHPPHPNPLPVGEGTII